MLTRKVYPAGIENVQAAQKYITGLDARRISKQSDLRYIFVLLSSYAVPSIFSILTCISLLLKLYILFQDGGITPGSLKISSFFAAVMTVRTPKQKLCLGETMKVAEVYYASQIS